MGLHLTGADENTEDQDLSRSLGWFTMQNEWVVSWTGSGNSFTGGEKLLPGRGGFGEGICLGSSRLACVEGQSGQILRSG